MELGQRPHFHLAGMVKIWIRRIIMLTCLTQREDGWRVHAPQHIQSECQHYFLKLFSTLNNILNLEILWYIHLMIGLDMDFTEILLWAGNKEPLKDCSIIVRTMLMEHLNNVVLIRPVA